MPMYINLLFINKVSLLCGISINRFQVSTQLYPRLKMSDKQLADCAAS